MRHLAHVFPVLYRDRLVEMPLAAQRLNLRLGRVRAESDPGRIAWNHPGDHEHEHRHARQHHERGDQAMDQRPNERRHRRWSSAADEARQGRATVERTKWFRHRYLSISTRRN